MQITCLETMLAERIEATEVAELVLFLASGRSRMITGQEFGINGGR